MAIKVNWKKMLTQWSDAIFASREYSQLLGIEAESGKWAGFPPASETAIAEAEERLKLRLPESYREFPKVSNGWWLDGTGGPIRLWGVEEIRPLIEVDPELSTDWGDLDEDAADPADLPNSHLKSVIQISDVGDSAARYLLNPLMKPFDEEWQAAFFANWVPGARCFDSFGRLMIEKFEAFVAAHARAEVNHRSVKNLSEPPEDPIIDEHKLIEELQSLGYFDFVSDATKSRMIRDFIEVCLAFKANRRRLLEGPFASPGAVLTTPESGRVINLEIERLVQERGRYAITAVEPLLRKIGFEPGNFQEKITPDSYSVSLHGVTHEYFRLRHGYPFLQGGEHERNAARYVLYETAKLLNKVLLKQNQSARIATLEEHLPSFASIAPMRLAFVLLDDELSYLLMWSPVIHSYCRPIRPDV